MFFDVCLDQEWKGTAKQSRDPPHRSERSDDQSVLQPCGCKPHLCRQTAEGFKSQMDTFTHLCVSS